MSRRILKKIRSLSPRLPKKEKQQLKAKIVFELRPKYPLKMLLEIAKMSRGSYLYQLRKAPSKCLDIVYSEQIAAIKKIHSDSKERYGYRRVMYALRNQGVYLNHKTVHKLMHHLQLHGANPKAYKKYNSYKGPIGKIAPNILNREFNPSMPMTSFATDITEFAIAEGKLYLSPIIDMCTNEIVAYDIARRATFEQIDRMLNRFGNVLKKYNVSKALVHSDQGWQYQNIRYSNWLKEHNLVQSMSRKDNMKRPPRMNAKRGFTV
ncbi:MAG: IS3 family transposase [Agathobacter sp.]|nr:IS3 family transposase [Agathobacter sp.]